jgi:hypothetical protein
MSSSQPFIVIFTFAMPQEKLKNMNQSFLYFYGILFYYLEGLAKPIKTSGISSRNGQKKKIACSG